MDGQIDRGRKKHALYPNPLDRGVGAKIAKLDVSSKQKKTVRSCSEVRSRLKRSSSPETLPDRLRTVSSMDSTLQKATHSFDFRFVASDDEVRQLLIARTFDEHQDVTVISHPDDLSQANLVSRLSISGDGRHTLRSGKLFESSQPLTLVMDIRHLSSDDLPKFNDLLDPDNPCLYDKINRRKRPLGGHVSLLVVADPAQLASIGERDDAPGADFWRRINRPGNTWQFEAQTGDDPAMDIDEVPPVLTELPSAESAMDDDNTVLIDCHLHAHWRHLLLGGPGVDKQGRIRHIPGRLESLRAGQRVILKGANWQDLAFEQMIRQMLAKKCFESNGKICPLPDDVQFYRMPVRNNELHSLFKSLFHSRFKKGDKRKNASRSPIIINQSNITQWLNPIAIAPEGYAIPNTRLLKQIRAGGVVTVTSPLTEALWFRLLGSLQTIRETTGVKPQLQVADSRRQPKALGLAENNEQPIRNHAAFDTITYQRPVQASYWINNQPETPLLIQVNEQTSFSQLFDNIHITSEQKAHFGRRQSKLQMALTTGKPVVFRGLESNPTLQQLLEPLAVDQPLLVNGQLQAYPKAHFTLLWPETAKSPSSVWSAMIAKGKPCPEVDPWDINAHKHDICRTELPEQALNDLYKAFETVPAHLCNPLPEITEGLLNNLILAARRAKQFDHAAQLLPRHWRKAINSVITHGTRQHPPVRDFMKVACWHLLPGKILDTHKNKILDTHKVLDTHKIPKIPDTHNKKILDTHKIPNVDQTASVDPDRLNAIINSALQLDRAFVKQNLWQLARAFDPVIFKDTGFQLSYESPMPGWAQKKTLDRLCAIIVAHRPEAQRDTMAYQLEIDPATAEPCQSLTIWPSRQIKRLQDALASGWQLALPPGQTRSDTLHALATDCFHRARTANSEAEGIERIEHRLSESLKWTGSADRPLSALARDLYHGKMNQKDRESRRLSRLHDRLADSPVIFLQGETGTGKSYFSAKVAKASGQAAVISLGPSDSEQTLMKQWRWQEYADGDRSMAQQNRALMEWASIKPDENDKFVTLVLDEANLAKTGLLASLNGLWEPEPCIYVGGQPVPVGTKHRVILTGNPDHYAGRQLDPALKEKLPRAYYPRLDQAFLRDCVVEPALVNQLQRHLPEPEINDIAHSATQSVMVLWQYYQELLPEHEFTPRDLTDICSWVGWYLDRALPTAAPVTSEQINSLIQQVFRDLLGPEISEAHKDAQLALDIWFAARFEPDKTLSDKVHNQTLPDIHQAFINFTEQTRPEFDTSGSAVRELAKRLGQDLSRCQQAYHLNRKHDGRQATLIEGPAGRGKDATLYLMIESVKQQAEARQESMPEVFYLNACDCSWDKLCEKIRTAKIKGGIVVISEMNLIDSQHLEGELNDILAGDAHPGFHLFATTNPPEYSGRKPLSPALKGRFRHLPICQYSPAELQTIAGKVLPETREGKILAKKLTQLHCRLRAYLQRKNLPLQPTSLDLQNVARAVIQGDDDTEKGLHQCFNQYYRLYLMAANISLEELPESSSLAMGRREFALELSKWFNQALPDMNRPWLLRLSNLNSLDEKCHEIRINADLNDKEARTEIIRMVAQARWQASGLSLNPDGSDDILNQALYRHWQQCWFAREFDQAGVNANSVFPLTEDEEQTLKLPASQPYLRDAEQQIESWNAKASQLWPAFWQQIRRLPNPVNKALAISVDKAAEKYDPELHEKEFEALDQMTNYQYQEKPQIDDHIVFDTRDFPSEMYRCSANDIFVSAKGDITPIELSNKHPMGIEILTPDPLPEHNQPVVLADNQTLATLNVTPDNGQYALPSLTPDDYIVALRIEPDLAFTLVRDQYTGLHTLSVPEAKANQSIRVTYIVEPLEPGENTSAEGSRSERFDACCSEGMKSVLDKVFENIDEQSGKVRFLLQKIKDSKNTKRRIKLITRYCQQFSGDAIPERKQNFFEFLVTKRHGSCRHRVPVFIAFCRYFGIPSRQMNSSFHSFAEYSLDEGQTWKSVHLGGSPVLKTEIPFNSEPTGKENDSGTESKMSMDLLRKIMNEADLAQQQALAEACDISLEELNKALQTNSELPEKNPSTSEILNKLWKKKDLPAFAMGVSIIKSLETGALGYYEKEFKPISEALKKILYKSDEDRITERLKSLHSKMIIQDGACVQRWLGLIVVATLEGSDLNKPSVIHFAREVLESGWLDPVPNYNKSVVGAFKHHRLLLRLENVDELKVKASHCLKKFYKQLWSREKNSQVWRLAYERYLEIEDDDFLVTHCHDGFSQYLENKIVSSSLQFTWTKDPEGIPNIERMLTQDPAFLKPDSGKVNHRPVIIMGQIFRNDEVTGNKVEALFQKIVEKSPELKNTLQKINTRMAMKKQRFNTLKALKKMKKKFQDDLKHKCAQAIEEAFCHYLYGLTHSKGGYLTYCWAETCLENSANSDYCGAHEPSSPDELYMMMQDFNSSSAFQKSVKDAYLRQSLNANNALVLKDDDMGKIYQEFFNTVNLDSLSDSLVYEGDQPVTNKA
ncbi:AAA family ATPase [Endozoicomonas sp. ALD040]|uniref:AAA family ATPase n=1 Tax=Endozoicomonas sp. ALD040 TaxID=3403079 RepID=UPI003BAF66B8